MTIIPDTCGGYTAPTTEVIEIIVERCFAASLEDMPGEDI